MNLIIYSILLGVLFGLLNNHLFNKKELYNNKFAVTVIIAVTIIGGLCYPIGNVINNIVIDSNAGYMPSDMNIVNELGREVIEDRKHRNVYKEPFYPEWIDKYYLPNVSTNNLYSNGDLIGSIGFFLFFFNNN